MALQKPITNFAAFVEGEAEAQNLIYALADEITSAEIPRPEGGIDANRWEEVYRSPFNMWVTYSTATRANVLGKYKHTDDNLYQVWRLSDFNGLNWKTPGAKPAEWGTTPVDSNGILREMKDDESGTFTGRTLQVKQFSYVDNNGNTIYVDISGLLAVVVPDLTSPVGFRAYYVKQVQTLSNGSVVDVDDWNEFELVTELPTDWAYFLSIPSRKIVFEDKYVGTPYYSTYRQEVVVATEYKFSERYYVANPVHSVPAQVVLKATPTVPTGIPVRDYYVLLEQPINDYNYIDVSHGVGFVGQNYSGNSKLTYEGICDPATVKPGMTPTIIDQAKAQAMFEKWSDPVQQATIFVPPVLKWQLDYDGVTEIVSPASHFFHGRDSTTSWLPNKKRRPDYLVSYSLSVNNDRVVIVLEGDPSPNIHGYYRSFGYIGKIVPFNQYDHMGNFGITVGMGDLKTEMTGFTKNDILTDLNPHVYAQYGEYTSNGMDSLSMLRTRSNVLFQRYYPAFITQLPNYPSVGTLPPGLSKLILDKDGFQKSLWTGKYHASPIYLVHEAEGYRGYMDGVVAIYDQNLVNRDELIVDTEILKDPTNPALGTWTEVYKFFSLKSPVNLFKHSPSPDVITVAILKEIK